MNPSTNGQDTEDEIDLMEYVRVLYRRRWVVLGVLVAVVLAGTLYTLGKPKLYAARTSVIINPRAPEYLGGQVGDVSEGGTSYYWTTKEYYATQHQVMQSYAVARRVADKLGLHKDHAFLGANKIKDDEKRREYLEKVDPVALLQKRIQIAPQKDTRLVHIVVNDTDPERAALLSNEIADAYIAEDLALKEKTTGNASEWLEDRLAGLESQTRKSEVALYDFKKQADMLSTSLEDRANMVSQRLTAVNAALTEVKVTIAGLKARVDAIEALRRDLGGDETQWADLLAIPDAQRDLIRELKFAHVSALVTCAELRDRYLPEHPRLKECDEKTRVAGEGLERELRTIVIAQKVELAEAQKKEANLLKLLEETKADAFEVNKRHIEHDRLKREAENDQRLYEVVLRRIKELELSGMMKVSNSRVLDRARPDRRPIEPNLSVALALFLLLGSAAGIIVALVLERFDDSMADQQDVEARLGLPFLGVVPAFPAGAEVNGRDLLVHHDPRSIVAEHCRAVRTNLLFMSPEKSLKSLLVTSSGPQEGKSTSVVSLGITMAQNGSRVLLIDTDMRRPRLHKAFGMANDIGISSLIMGEQDINRAIKETSVPGVFLLSCGPIPPNPAELLHTDSFGALLQQLSERFDNIILDSPPIGAVADALVLATRVDGVLLVVRAGRTRLEHARRALRALRQVNARLYGAVLNSVDLRKASYSGYYYGAYQRYDSEERSRKRDEAA